MRWYWIDFTWLMLNQFKNVFSIKKLLKADCPTIDTTSEEMKTVPYNSICKTLIYVIVVIHPDIAHAIGLIRIFMS